MVHLCANDATIAEAPSCDDVFMADVGPLLSDMSTAKGISSASSSNVDEGTMALPPLHSERRKSPEFNSMAESDPGWGAMEREDTKDPCGC